MCGAGVSTYAVSGSSPFVYEVFWGEEHSADVYYGFGFNVLDPYTRRTCNYCYNLVSL